MLTGEQVERLEALPDEWRKRAQEAEDDGLFTAADAIRYCAHELSRDIPALLQLARAVQNAQTVRLEVRSETYGHGSSGESLVAVVQDGYYQQIDKSRVGQTVALVPVTVEEEANV